jgi:CheY-like chemotaxis protein/HPt (histidine-containing phosphotransfer) domain-containing protein
MRCEVCDSLNIVQDQVTRLLAAGERIDAVLLAEPLADSGILEAAMALRPKLDAIVCCLDEAHKNVATESRAELKTGLSALGVSVIQKPMKQSALLDALMLAWSKCCEPASRAPATAVAGAPTRFFHRSPRRLLLAEDNAVNQRVAFVVLEKLGYAVDVVDNGTEAIQRAVAGNYAAALMDCQMPETDGFQATQAIRRAEMQTGRRLPIIAMTANALDGDRERCIAAGMDDYIPKPIDAEALKEVLMRWTADSSIDAMPSAQNPASHPSSDAVELAPAVELGRLIDIFGDDRGTIVELLTLFRSSIEQTRIALDHELTTRGAKVKNLAHEIKGMSANMGAERLSAMAAHLEDNADNGDWEAIERLGRSIEHEVPRILAFIDAFVQTGKPLDSGAASPSGQEAQELR